MSGGIVTIAPGKGGLATFSPPLDPAGNSVRGQLATKLLSEALGLDILASQRRGGGAVAAQLVSPGLDGLLDVRTRCGGFERPADPRLAQPVGGH